MKKLGIIFTIFVTLARMGWSQEFLDVKGRQIVDGKGNPFILKGVNLGFWLEPEGYPFGIRNIYAARHYFDFADAFETLALLSIFESEKGAFTPDSDHRLTYSAFK